jgi:hypothetical protein
MDSSFPEANMIMSEEARKNFIIDFKHLTGSIEDELESLVLTAPKSVVLSVIRNVVAGIVDDLEDLSNDIRSVEALIIKSMSINCKCNACKNGDHHKMRCELLEVMHKNNQLLCIYNHFISEMEGHIGN